MWLKTKDSRIKKRGEVYWARFMKRGQHVQESLETKSFEIAKRMVENIEGDILLGVNWKKERELFETAWEEFLIDKAKGIKTKKARKKTLREYVGFGERFYKPYLGELRLSQLEDGWAEMVEKIKKEKPNIQFDNIRKYLSGFSSWAYRKGKIRLKPEFYDPDIERKSHLEKQGPGLAYTLDQLRVMRLIAVEQSPRFYLFMMMAQYMGMRPGEITQLKKDRIDLGDGVIRLRRADTKNDKHREIPIHRYVRPFLEAQLKASGASPCLFPNKRNKQEPMDPQGFKKYWVAILINPEIQGRVYDFRHTFITHAIKQGMNPSVVAKMTGTSLKMIDERYLHLTSKDLSKDLEKFIL